MRRVDLLCKLGGPLLIALVDGYSTRVAIVVTLALSIVSLPIEYFAIARVYALVPALHSSPQPAKADPCAPSTPLPSSSTFSTLRTYLTHPATAPSLSTSLLYLTVLSFSAQMTTYLLALPWTSTVIGVLRTVAVAAEVSATWLAPAAMRRVGPVRAGIWFLNWQLMCLVVGVGVFWPLDGKTRAGEKWIGAGALVGGVMGSRIGLWGVDLCAQVIIQEVSRDRVQIIHGISRERS